VAYVPVDLSLIFIMITQYFGSGYFSLLEAPVD
jgi:hypothetical protein